MTMHRMSRRMDRIIIVAGIIAATLLIADVLVSGVYINTPGTPEEKAASELMTEMVAFISAENNLIGPEISDITTTLGDEAAKRTTLNPAFAALTVKLLRQAGVKGGDTIAIACSGSFPGLLIASLAAAEAMNIHPVSILSLGSSSFGASDPSFTILDLHMKLLEAGYVSHQPAAVSAGGDKDTGTDMEPGAAAMLAEKAARYGIQFISEPTLIQNRHVRDSIYTFGGRGSLSAFINAGGGYASMGTSSLALVLRPGLVRTANLPPPDSRGVIHDMLEKGTPVIHYLNIKTLAYKNGIKIDSTE